MARRPAARPGDGPQRRPRVLRHGRHLRLLRGDTVWRAEARRFREGRLLLWGIPATRVLGGTLLDHGGDGDVAEAEFAVERLEAAPADDGLVIREIWLLRLHALLARARGDDTAYRDYRDRY